MVNEYSTPYDASLEKIKAYNKAYRNTHREKRKAYNKAYHNTHREQRKAYLYTRSEHEKVRKKAYREAHREQEIARQKAYLEVHRDEIKARKKAYREAHLTQFNASQKAYREANPDKIKARDKAYRKANPEIMRMNRVRRRARKHAAPINDLTAAQWRTIKAHYRFRCVYCNRTMKRLTMDHIIPLSKGGAHTYTNIVPACSSCNSKKSVGAPLKPVQPLLVC